MKKKEEQKKKYETPKLKAHGDLAKLTKTKGSTKTDNSGLPKTKSTGTVG